MAAAAIIMVRIKRIFSFLRERGAISPESAIPEFEVPWSRKWYYRRLINHGAIKRVDGRCYLDETLARSFFKERYRRAAIFLTIAMLAWFACWLLWELI